MTPPQDRYIDVNGIRTRYWDVGEGPPVVLVHGIGASVETWTGTLPALAPDHRVVALDVVGYGYTDKPRDAPYTFPYFADFVRRSMDALEIPEAAVVGHSLGGGIVLKLVERVPSRVTRLVVVDAAGLGTQGLSIVYPLMAIPGLGRWLTRPDPRWTRRFKETYNALPPLRGDRRRVEAPAALRDPHDDPSSGLRRDECGVRRLRAGGDAGPPLRRDDDVPPRSALAGGGRIGLSPNFARSQRARPGPVRRPRLAGPGDAPPAPHLPALRLL